MNQLTKSGKISSRIKKTLLYHGALIADIKSKYQNARKEKEKQLISKVAVGQIVKKYRLLGFAENALGFSKKRRSLVVGENVCKLKKTSN